MEYAKPRPRRCGFLSEEQVRELTLQGVSRPDIAMRAGVSLDRVTKFRRDIGINKPRNYKQQEEQ